MAVRTDFTAGEVLAAADLNDTFASKPPFAYGTATPTTTVEGFIFYDENDTPPTAKFWDGSAFQSIGGGKILQLVRATDATDRTTTSTSFVDVTGMTVTITPTKNTSAILVIATFTVSVTGNDSIKVQLTNAANTALSGAEENISYTTTTNLQSQILWGYNAPATTSATTYKMRFRSNGGGSMSIYNGTYSDGQLYAIEVSA